MGTRSVQELPVRILTDEELLGEFDRTFTTAVSPPSNNGNGNQANGRAVRRNAAAMEELLRRGYRSKTPNWSKTEPS
ncbi:MAG: hypothetical protein ABFS21_06010 [Actinomycetota bacterium]